MPRPLVSIVIPTYNLAEILVGRSIRSVLQQSYREIECLVIDDGSTDDTEARVRVCAAADNRVRYIKKENSGQASARNLGIREFRGAFIVFHDHDDELFPEFVEKSLTAFERLPQVSYMSSYALNRLQSGTETVYIPALHPFWKLSIGNGWIFRGDVLKKRGFSFDEAMSGFEDLDFHIQFHEADEKGHIIPEPLRRYYVNLPRLVGGGSYSSSNYARQAGHFKKFMEKNEAVYAREGKNASGWLYHFYASLCLKAGDVHEARGASRKAFSCVSSLRNFLYLLLSIAGFRVYRFLYMLKVRSITNNE